MDRWGVWTDNDGGFVTDPCYSEAEAAEIRDDMIDADPSVFLDLDASQSRTLRSFMDSPYHYVAP